MRRRYYDELREEVDRRGGNGRQVTEDVARDYEHKGFSPFEASISEYRRQQDEDRRRRWSEEDNDW